MILEKQVKTINIFYVILLVS